MKIIIEIPDQAKADYNAIHHAIVQKVGLMGQIPMSISQADCTTHPENYKVVLHDRVNDQESWRSFTVLSFEHRPYAPFPPMEKLPEDMEEELAHQAVCDYEAARQQKQEDESLAIVHAMERDGVLLALVTPNSAHSPTGRRYNNEPDFNLYENHIVVTQHGGIDC